MCLGLWSYVTASSAWASGFPDFDPAHEVILHGKVAPQNKVVSGVAERLGAWTETAGQLSLPAQDGPGNRFWLVKTSAAQLANGLVRARLRPGKRLDAGVLFRVQAGIDLKELSGYELSIDADTLRIQRWDRGRALPVGAAVEVAGLSRHASLEVVIYLVGPQILATVYDGDTLKRLASLAAHETTHRRGRVGFRAGRRQANVQFGLLSVMDSTRVPPLRKGSGKHGALKLYGPNADSGTTPFGNTRFVFIAAADLKRVPPDLRKTVQARIPGPHGTRQAVLFTDALGLERLKRAGIAVLAADSNVPWKTFDPAYRKHAALAPVATRRGYRLDLSYKNAAMVEALLRAYADKYPQLATLVELGRSHQGRAIWALKVSDHAQRDEDEPAVLFNGAHHASELLSVEYPLDAVATLLEGYGRDPDVTGWVNALEIFVVPLVNPDGNHMFLEETRFASRKNARDTNLDGFSDPFEGVDLNRNYFFGWGQDGSSGVRSSKYYRGPHPGSEPETWAMMRLAERQHFAASISFHTVGSAIFVPYMASNAVEPKPNTPLVVARELAEAGLEQPSKKKIRVRPGGYPVAGSDQDWLLHRFGTLAYVLEGSHHNPSLAVRTQAVDATRPIWKALLQRLIAGPRVSGHVRAPDGKPIVAEVVIEEIELHEGERWNTRPRDGRFDRIVARPGQYTVSASAPGYKPRTQRVRVRAPVTLDFTLELL